MEAKIEIFKIGHKQFQSSGEKPNGWADIVNTKGQPILRKANDEKTKEYMDTDDIIHMYEILNPCCTLPYYVARRINRIPPAPIHVNIQQNQPTLGALEDIIVRIQNIEKRIEKKTVQTSYMHKGLTHEAEKEGEIENNEQPENSQNILWSEVANKLTKEPMQQPNKTYDQKFLKKKIMVKGKNNKTSGMKTIPRRAICFAARLDLDTEAEELTNFFLIDLISSP